MIEDISPTPVHYQKTGCIEALPVEIFRIIRWYSGKRNYLELMCANLKTFRAVKYETVYYPLRISKILTEKDVLALQQIIQSVKDQRKQISVTLFEMNAFYIGECRNFYNDVDMVSIKGFPVVMNRQFSFSVFIPVRQLIFKNVQCSFPVDLSLLPELTILKLINCHFPEIVAWNSRDKLQDVLLENCENVLKFPALENISAVSISTKRSYPNNFKVGQQERLIFSGTYLQLTTLQSMTSHSLFLCSINELKITCAFPTGFTSYSCFQKISILQLHHIPQQEPLDDLPFLPAYFGKNLSLKSFNLSCWSGMIFPTLEVCSLDDCYSFSTLPGTPLLHKLIISDCELTTIPSLPSLATLDIRACNELELIGLLPNLCKAKIAFCNRLSHISGLSNVQTLTLISCRLLKTIPSLKNLTKLEIKNCENLSNLQEITQLWSNFMKEKRTVHLSNLPALADFLFCRNIYSLKLSDLSGLQNCTGISNIQELVIEFCDNFTTTDGLGIITRKLLIGDCSSLASFVGVKNIPTIETFSCPELFDFNGLGNNELVRIEGSPLFGIFLEEYQKEQSHEEVFSTIQHLFFTASDQTRGKRIW
jgi:hypothetical protein